MRDFAGVSLTESNNKASKMEQQKKNGAAKGTLSPLLLSLSKQIFSHHVTSNTLVELKTRKTQLCSGSLKAKPSVDRSAQRDAGNS